MFNRNKKLWELEPEFCPIKFEFSLLDQALTIGLSLSLLLLFTTVSDPVHIEGKNPAKTEFEVPGNTKACS